MRATRNPGPFTPWLLGATAAFMLLIGCQEQMPLDVEHRQPEAALPAGERAPLRWRVLEPALHRPLVGAERVDPDSGGHVQIYLDAGPEPGVNTAGVAIDFIVPPASVVEPIDITIDLDNEFMDLICGPSGTTFSPAAQLSIAVTGLDLGDVAAESIQFSYYNPEIDEWEPVECDAIIVEQEIGRVEVQNARIHHFSRYALTHR